MLIWSVSHQKKYCGMTVEPVKCLYCDVTFTCKDAMLRHVRTTHAEAAKRKRGETVELDRMEVLQSDRVPRLTIDEQSGEAVSTRGTKRSAEDDISTGKVHKPPGRLQRYLRRGGAMQWMHHEDIKLGGNNRIRHVRNELDFGPPTGTRTKKQYLKQNENRMSDNTKERHKQRKYSPSSPVQDSKRVFVSELKGRSLLG